MGHGILILLGLIVAGAWVARLQATLKFRRGPHILNEFSRDALTFPAPKVSVIIPARNEEMNIGGCLESLLKQDYPNYEIIVVNDRSEDRTAEIIREFVKTSPRLKLIEIEKLPAGWTGKTNALVTAEKSATGDWLLFTDADTVHRPRSISTAVGHAMLRKADMLSLLPSLANISFWENVMQPVTGSALMLWFRVAKVNDPSTKVAFGNGQYILIKKTIYDKIGGHARVKDFVLEDMALARRVKESGFSLHLGYGADLFKTRMYASLKQVWHGWTRIYYSAMEKKAGRIALMMFLVAAVSFFPYALGLYALYLLITAPLETATLFVLGTSVVLFLVIVPTLINMFRLTRSNTSYVVFHPIASIILFLILTNTLGKIVFNRAVHWRGHRYVEKGI